MSKVGALERGNPLPDGQYWFDAFGMNIPKADNWLKAFSGLGVHTDATQHFPSDSLSNVRTWYKFTFKNIGSPVVWDTSLGYPTVADASIQSSSDTAQTPPLPLDPLDELGNWINSVEVKLGGSLGTIAGVIPYAMLGAGGFAVYYLVKELGLVGKVKKSVRRLNKAS